MLSGTSLSRLTKLKNNAVLFQSPVSERFVEVINENRGCCRIFLRVRDDEKLHASLLVESLEEAQA